MLVIKSRFKNRDSMNNIYVIGMMGSGKSVVSEKLGLRLHRKVKEVDALIVQEESMSINDIFASKGEGYFRGVEKNILKRVSQSDQLVVSTGGGIVLDDSNYDVMDATGVTVYLFAEAAVLCTRLEGATDRPLLVGDSLRDKIDTIFGARKTLYEKSTVIVDTSSMAVDDVVDAVVARLQEMSLL